MSNRAFKDDPSLKLTKSTSCRLQGNAQLVETQQAISVAYSTLVVQLQPTPGRLPLRTKTATAKQVAGMMEQGFQETLTGRTNREKAALAGVAGWLCDLLVHRFQEESSR